MPVRRTVDVSHVISFEHPGISVKNAGLVILSTYTSILFERLGLIEDKLFKTEKHQLNAVQYLQCLATGSSHTEEQLLALNKIMCGLPLSASVPDKIEVSPEDRELIHGLIKAAIGYWAAIGECSVDGFRGNWLVRDGLLREQADKWELTVEKRAYDVLINKSPFSFSTLKHPWMDKPIHVSWPH